MIRFALPILAMPLLASCDVYWGKTAENEVLDQRVIEGCYVSTGIASLRLHGGKVFQDGKELYSAYKYAKIGRNNERAIIVSPPSDLTLGPNGSYYFKSVDNSKRKDNSYRLHVEDARDTIVITSTPDNIAHRFSKAPC